MPSGFHDVRFPDDISFGSSGGPEFSTSIVTSSAGFEQRNSEWSQARAKYNVAYGVRTDAQLSALIAFFRARMGKAFAFRFKDWADYQSAPIGSSITALDQVLGTGNGNTRTFTFLKAYTSGGYSLVRPMTHLVADTVRLSLQGTEVSSGFVLDTLAGTVTFDAAPATGVIVRAGFAFDVPVRFDTDYLATSLDSYGVGSALDVPVVEVRG